MRIEKEQPRREMIPPQYNHFLKATVTMFFFAPDPPFWRCSSRSVATCVERNQLASSAIATVVRCAPTDWDTI